MHCISVYMSTKWVYTAIHANTILNFFYVIVYIYIYI